MKILNKLNSYSNKETLSNQMVVLVLSNGMLSFVAKFYSLQRSSKI